MVKIDTQKTVTVTVNHRFHIKESDEERKNKSTDKKEKQSLSCFTFRFYHLNVCMSQTITHSVAVQSVRMEADQGCWGR